MKPRIRIITALSIVLSLVMVSACSDQDSLTSTLYENQQDYSYMWWKNTIKTGNQVFAIKTSHYALSFDYARLAIEDFSIRDSRGEEDVALHESNEASFPVMSPCGLSFGLEQDGSMSWCDSSSGIDDDCQLVECGKYFQRRFITNLPGLKNCDTHNSGLLISSWPDRISFILKAMPSSDLQNPGLVTEISFPEKFSVLIEEGEVLALKDPDTGSGYVILKSDEAAKLVVEGSSVKVRLDKKGICRAGEELNSGIIVYPLATDIDKEISRIAKEEEQPLIVTAEQIAPETAELKVDYSIDQDWHRIILRNDKTEGPRAETGEGNPDQQEELNNRIERVLFTVSNPLSTDRVARLNFAKGRLIDEESKVFAHTGISVVLRDQEGIPVGIPVQLSKNWHTGGRSGVETHYFRGTWYHGLCMITIPANSSITLEYTSVNSLWGGVPAASHAQLCLIGWGSNQQWDESAIGAWGESITYEPDLDQASAPVLDFRPLLVKSPNGRKWGWTGNMGGADIFNYTKSDGNRGWHSRMRTQYKRYSPNFTEVSYAGTMDDRSMDFEYTASVGRSDDITRGFYKIKMKVNEDVDFKDFVVFQAAAATYKYTTSNTLAWGNEDGLKAQWAATTGEESRYITPKQVAEGKVPWFSFTDGGFTTPHQDSRFLPANRGIVIREWKARINGVDDTPPWFAEYLTNVKSHGGPSNLINIIPPEGCNSFRKGDYIEAEIELFITPRYAEDYYGPNENFVKALETKVNTWELTYREAVGNDLEVTATSGKVLDSYPIRIITEDGQAEFSVSGGIGYVPLILSNVSDYRKPSLYKKVNDSWQLIDQSVHGNDFWQADYDASTGTWDISYNLDMDTPGDERQTFEYRFELSK